MFRETGRADQLPHVQGWSFDEWPTREDGEIVEFRLLYHGRLPAASQENTRRDDKHRIRRFLHPQLRELWRTHPTMRAIGTGAALLRTGQKNYGKPEQIIDRLPDDYARCGYRFLPLVCDYFGLACALDILFLRRDGPGGLIRHGGDLDNRIKVLLDALRMPDNCDDVRGFPPAADENPFYCLLQDDKLITELRVTTDRLLVPLGDNEHENDVRLVIRVKTAAVVGEIAGQIV